MVKNAEGRPVGMRGVMMDITAGKETDRAKSQLEEELRQAQKIESIGRLAGGVAHDFNNLLTAINGYADLMLEDLAEDHRWRGAVTEIRRAGERAADLTGQLLAFSRRQLLQPRVLDLNVLVTDSTKMLKRLLGEDIEVITRLDPTLGHVTADAGQMHQIILNLAVNARDAMPRGGRLTIETQNVVLDEEQLRAARFRQAPTSCSPSATTARAWIRRRCRRSSIRSSRPRNRPRAPGLACRRFTASSSRAAVRFSSTANRAGARRSRSTCPQRQGGQRYYGAARRG